MFNFTFVANLQFPNGRLQGVRGEFTTEVGGEKAHYALIGNLKSRHTSGDQVPQVTIFYMHPATAE